MVFSRLGLQDLKSTMVVLAAAVILATFVTDQINRLFAPSGPVVNYERFTVETPTVIAGNEIKFRLHLRRLRDDCPAIFQSQLVPTTSTDSLGRQRYIITLRSNRGPVPVGERQIEGRVRVPLTIEPGVYNLVSTGLYDCVDGWQQHPTPTSEDSEVEILPPPDAGGGT